MKCMLVMIDLTAEDRATIRARLADSSIEVRNEQPGLWHLFRDDQHAAFKLLGTAANGDRVFCVVGPAKLATWLQNKLGARVELLLDAWNNPTTVGVLGGLTRQAWLIAHGIRTYVVRDGGGALLATYPCAPHTFAGLDPRALGRDYLDLPDDAVVSWT